MGASCSTQMDRRDDAATYRSFANAPKTWILLTFYGVFCAIHTVNSDYFPTQNYDIGRNSEGVLCAVRTDECQSSKG